MFIFLGAFTNFRFECNGDWQQFQAPGSDDFIMYLETECQADALWDLEYTGLYECKCKLSQCQLWIERSYINLDLNCIDPPDPPVWSNMRLEWNATYPPSHNETVMYVCDAGDDWNRFESDFNQWNLTLTCLPDNQFTPVEWPTCLNGINMLK